jgi:hypothetical protein
VRARPDDRLDAIERRIGVEGLGEQDDQVRLA